MLRKYLLVPALLAVGGLMMVDSTQAAPRGTRGGGRAAVGRSNSDFRAGNYGRGYYGGGYGRGYYGGGYGRGEYGRGYYGGGYYGGWPFLGLYGGYWPGSYSGYQTYWDDSYPYVNTYPNYGYGYSYAPTTAYNPAYAQTMPNVAPLVAANGSAEVEVILPDPQARVMIDGALTRETGTDRMFTTPPLAARGTYRIRASWNVAGQEVTQERIVSVAPSQLSVVDFTRPVGG